MSIILGIVPFLKTTYIGESLRAAFEAKDQEEDVAGDIIGQTLGVWGDA